MKFLKTTVIFLFLISVCAVPVMGVDTFLGGAPHISASISGTNEFSPGQAATITILVLNSGVNTDKFVMTGTIDRPDNPTTARMVMVGLSAPGGVPIIIKSDTQNIGDIPSQVRVPVTISAKITQDATEGEYQLPLSISYTYLASSDQPAADVLQSQYQQANLTIPITIKIKPQVTINVLNSSPENLSVGTSGYLDLTIVNNGTDNGTEATVALLRNGNSPIVPVDSSVYIGDFPLNQPVTCRYRIAISSNAEAQTYPVDVAVTYKNSYGDIVASASQTVGVPVFGKVVFTLVSEPASVTPGSDNTITVRYRNDGAVTAYDAQSRLSAEDPFTSSDNTAYLGDIKPGDTVTAQYQITADSGAAPGNYSIDSEVQYRDVLDNIQVSDTFKVPVLVVAPPPASGIVSMLPAIIVTVLIVAGAGYYLLVMRKKK
ncbi:COG1361 S-layer family protein [Methanoregula sp.]|jgi:hypothetical protein|uniref:COG1361 S-layer family protein n=1 Tax=Methanoregula sp. TaxID=2052170 RepID=UPI003C19892B